MNLPNPNLALSPESQTFRRKDTLPLRSRCLWKIETGFIRALTWDEEGEIATLGFWGVGDIVGQSLSQINPYRLECLTPVEVCVLPSEGWYPQYAVLAHAHQLEELLRIIRCHTIAMRLQRLLDWLACRFGQVYPQGWHIPIYLTHEEIAETIGTTRVTVTRLLREFEQMGRIQRSRRQLILLD